MEAGPAPPLSGPGMRDPPGPPALPPELREGKKGAFLGFSREKIIETRCANAKNVVF